MHSFLGNLTILLDPYLRTCVLSAQRPSVLLTPLSQRQLGKLAEPASISGTNETKCASPSPALIAHKTDSKPNTKSNELANESLSIEEKLSKCPRIQLNPCQEHKTVHVRKSVDEKSAVLANGKEKIILKIKAGVVEKKPSLSEESSESDDEVIVRKNRRSSHVIVSSGESAEEILPDSVPSIDKMDDEYAMLTQLALPTFSTKSNTDTSTLLKRTPKSPVFGVPPFEVVPAVPLCHVDAEAYASDNTKSRAQAFMSDRPEIGFHNIPARTTLLSARVSHFIRDL